MKAKHSLIALGAILFLAVSFFNSGCKHEPDLVILNPSDTTGTNSDKCDPDSVYFTQQILPIFQSSCAMSGCHDASSQQDGIILDSYTNILATGKIKISNPKDSKIYKVLIESGDDIMPPPPAAPTTAAQQNAILKWITQGAKNNSCISLECDTVNVKYSSHIKPLITNYCQGCHNGANSGGGIDLSAYAGVKAIADNGRFIGSISHIGNYSPMPKNGNKLSDCQIRIVHLWINSGSPNN